jgi:hypothetical protein
MAATDSTGLVSTPESYIKSAAYNMPVSPGELSGLDRQAAEDAARDDTNVLGGECRFDLYQNITRFRNHT